MGARIANVPNLRRGDNILLAYGGHGQPYHALFACKIAASAAPVHDERYLFDLFAEIDKSFNSRLEKSGYERDPILRRFTGISIKRPVDLGHITCPIPKPSGNNTIRRWEEVVRAGLMVASLQPETGCKTDTRAT
jgi:hypothetical protein